MHYNFKGDVYRIRMQKKVAKWRVIVNRKNRCLLLRMFDCCVRLLADVEVQVAIGKRFIDRLVLAALLLLFFALLKLAGHCPNSESFLVFLLFIVLHAICFSIVSKLKFPDFPENQKIPKLPIFPN